MSVTIEQIAKKAGVSAGTVSRILNGRTKANRPAIAKRAAKIRKIASDLGYRPNLAARTMLSGRFGQFAFVTCGDLGFDWFAPTLLHGIHEASEAIDARLVINELSGSQLADDDQLPRLFSEQAVDGMLINLDAKLTDTHIEVFDSQPVPAVLLNLKRKTRSVYPDDREGGRHAARHLIGVGRKNIGFMMLEPLAFSPHYSCVDRRDGVLDVLKDAGLGGDRMLFGHADYERAKGNGIALVDAFLDQHKDLDAVVCYSMMEAVVLFVAATLRGIKVPDDLHPVVFHHQAAHAETGVPMDTMVIPFKQVGLQAVQMLNGMIDAGAPRRVEARCLPYQQLYRAAEDSYEDLVAKVGEAKAEGQS